MMNRGNVEKSLAIVKKMMTEQEIDPRTIHTTLKTLKRVIHISTERETLFNA